jgi:hypothetical protein
VTCFAWPWISHWRHESIDTGRGPLARRLACHMDHLDIACTDRSRSAAFTTHPLHHSAARLMLLHNITRWMDGNNLKLCRTGLGMQSACRRAPGVAGVRVKVRGLKINRVRKICGVHGEAACPCPHAILCTLARAGHSGIQERVSRRAGGQRGRRVRDAAGSHPCVRIRDLGAA